MFWVVGLVLVAVALYALHNFETRLQQKAGVHRSGPGASAPATPPAALPQPTPAPKPGAAPKAKAAPKAPPPVVGSEPTPRRASTTATDFFDPPPPQKEEPAQIADPTAKRVHEILSDLDKEPSDPKKESFIQTPPDLQGLRDALQAGEAPDGALVGALAEDPLTRRPIYLVLKAAKKSTLIPQKYRTRKAMAEADIVVWLTDSDLGAPPSELELVDTLTLETSKDGPFDWYLYRFQTGNGAPMAGVSGPWPRNDGPSGEPGGDTGSELAPWDARGDEGQVLRVHGLMEAFEKKRGKKKGAKKKK